MIESYWDTQEREMQERSRADRRRMRMARPTAAQKHARMLERREIAMKHAVGLALDLHDAGISGLLFESTQIGTEDYHVRVIIDRDELGWDQLAKVESVAAMHDAKVSLGEVRMNQQSFSRFVLWPLHEEV